MKLTDQLSQNSLDPSVENQCDLFAGILFGYLTTCLTFHSATPMEFASALIAFHELVSIVPSPATHQIASISS